MGYFLLVFEFFFIKRFKAFIFNIGIPIIIGILIFHCADNCLYIKNTANFHTNMITVLGILIGFVISIFAVLLTLDNKNIESAKNHKLGFTLFKNEVNLYDSLLVGFAYLILILGLSLISNFIYPIFISIESNLGKLFFSINTAITIHAILILMRNILDFYFIVTKKD
jgi:hypothetical protein